ncbi:aminopeptidase LapA [Legionella fairfieldensis]|uniref:aminopeptidase LapA n=1 Tax=Legionella fairfieldensis TaxID=45064 RepID=UPI00048C1063|nr:M20/M25/M40 family metallo-hydrolase [Legionella fairfieldensis]
MRLYQWKIGLLAGFMMILNSLCAKAITTTEQIQVPQCLAAKLPVRYNVLAENSAFKIIDLPATEINSLAHLADEVHCGRFINVSHYFAASNSRQQDAAKLLLKPLLKSTPRQTDGYPVIHHAMVNEAMARINAENIMRTVAHLTSYYNRSATRQTGVDVAEWLKIRFTTFAEVYGRQDTATYFVKTGKHYQQPSLVTVIGKDLKTPAVVIGAHMDTLDGYMPGAGDDASGSATIMETARVLLESPFTFKHPIYIVWYAAEERGLVGSQQVVQDFLHQKIPVKAVIQFDMTGFRSDNSDATMWVYRDYTDALLSDFTAELIKTYIHVPVAYSRCGYGCSDHASWMAEGIPAAFPCETSFAEHNPYIHTSADTINLLNTEHMTNFTKLALAFAIELASG